MNEKSKKDIKNLKRIKEK